MRTIKNKTMKRAVGLLMTVVLTVNILSAQSVTDGIKYLNYYKNKSALQTMQKAYEANAKDVNTIYWYGQALLANDNIKGAKEAYQKALQEGINDPMIWIGMGHVELMEGGDINAAKQKFEQAITATTETKGKNRNKPNAVILNAIGRANADGGSKIGDPNYAIDKLKQAGELDKLTAEIFVNMGILYQKLGGEMGGEAVKAYTEATLRDPKNADAFWHIGKIYASQGNKDMLEQYYNNAIAADPMYPNSYLGLFEYYQNRDISKAKEYLDKYIQYADKDCKTDFYYADYLFKAGKNQESLEKAKAMEAAGSLSIFPGLAVLLAKNYDKKGDTVLARSYIEPYITNTTPDKLINTDYEIAVKILSKFSGSQATLAVILEKAIAADTAKVNKLKYYKLGYEMLEKNNMYTDELKWYANYSALRGAKDEVYYYKTTSIAINAKEGAIASATAKEYIAAFPEKPNGYSMNVRAARLLDTANNLGILFEAVNVQNEFLLKDLTKNKQALINNYYTLIGYYNETKSYENAVLMCDKVLEIVPEDPTTLQAKGMFIKNIDIIKKMQNSKGGVPAPPLEKPAADTTQIKKG